MKKIALLLLAIITLNACSIDNNDPKAHLEVVGVDSFTVPESFVLGQTYEIKVKYKKPTDCYTFNGFYYDKSANIRTIGLQCTVLDRKDCAPLTDAYAYEVSFNFQATNAGSYIFKFYKGVDADGTDIFEQVEIPVVY